MNVIDAYRSQFYLKRLLASLELIKSKLNEISVSLQSNSESIMLGLSRNMADELDRIVLPAVAAEIFIAKEKGLLIGPGPAERYISFFLLGNTWTDEARGFLLKYRLLDELIETYLNTCTQNILEMLTRLAKDKEEIQKQFYLELGELQYIQGNASDRHNGGRQVLLLHFDNGEKLVYKASDLAADQLFREYVEFLQLERPFDLKTAPTIAQNGYGWIKFLASAECQFREQVASFYKRAGVLLAVADQLNYTDGHLENLLACAEYPVLIDLETLFHPLFYGQAGEERSVLNTGLIEKPPEDENQKGFTAALQTPGYRKYEILFPYPVNDRTDELRVNFRGVSQQLFLNAPVFNQTIYSPLEFQDDFLAGYQYAGQRILTTAEDWCMNSEWWQRVTETRVRLLVRHTLYYELMIRKAQQPIFATDRVKAEMELRKIMTSGDAGLDQLLDYEISDILNLDVPFFSHRPLSQSIRSGTGELFPNYLPHSAIEELWQNFRRKHAYFERNTQILKNILPASPPPVAIPD